MILKVALAASIVFNIFMMWYVYKLLRNLLEITDGFDEMRTKLVEFATHLRAINKVESFYGDPSITALIEHMKRLAADVEDYTQLLIIYEDDMEDENEQEKD